MNTKVFRLAALVFLLAVGAGSTSAQIGYSTNLVGYCNGVFMTGSNLFVNPFQLGSNALSQVFSSICTPWPPPPDGTTVSLWNPTTLSFDSTSTFSNGAWSVDLILPPGIGALLIAPSPFSNVFCGYLLNHDGSLVDGETDPPPPVFSGPNGIYLLGDKTPITDVGTNIFLNIVGRLPYIGEQVMQFSGISTYLGNGMWDSIPVLGACAAAFLNIMSEPAPSLTINYTNNQAIVSWPSSVLGWTLQTNNNLTTGNWGNYAGLVINNTVTNSTPTGNLFFRLSYQ
jgi:hypothetical protein